MNAAAFSSSSRWLWRPPVRFPDLSGLEPAVAEQIGEMRSLSLRRRPRRAGASRGLRGPRAGLSRLRLQRRARRTASATPRPSPRGFPLALPAGSRPTGRRAARRGGGGLRQALELAPDAAAGYVHLGEIRLLQGRPEEAEAALRKALGTPATVRRGALPARTGGAGAARLQDRRGAVSRRPWPPCPRRTASTIRSPWPIAAWGTAQRPRSIWRRPDRWGCARPIPCWTRVAGPAGGGAGGGDARPGGRPGRALRGRGPGVPEAPWPPGRRAWRRGSTWARSWLSRETGRAPPEQLREALRLDPANVTAHFNLGSLLLVEAPPGEARPHLEAAVAARPEDAEARRLLAQALRGRRPSRRRRWSTYAAPWSWRRETRPPGWGRPRRWCAWAATGRPRRRLEEDLRQIPTSGLLSHALARLLAACPDRVGARRRPRPRARPSRLAGPPPGGHAETVALALAELGRCEEAAHWQKTAIDAIQKQGQEGRVGGYESPAGGLREGSAMPAVKSAPPGATFL